MERVNYKTLRGELRETFVTRKLSVRGIQIASRLALKCGRLFMII